MQCSDDLDDESEHQQIWNLVGQWYTLLHGLPHPGDGDGDGDGDNLQYSDDLDDDDDDDVSTWNIIFSPT